MHKLDDGRMLMAAYDDIKRFFEENNIIGKTIKDIVPARYDYIILNIEEVDDFLHKDARSVINTDGQVCLVFDDDSNFEIEYSGDGPVILGYNTANFSDYKQYDGSCYKLGTLFQHCIGRSIAGIYFEKTDTKMMFPSYCGIDLSEEDDGVNQIKIDLNDGTALIARGSIDWFLFEHVTGSGDHLEVGYPQLISELNEEVYEFYFEDWIRETNTDYKKMMSIVKDMQKDQKETESGLRQYPSVRLQDAIFKYPPDWEAMEEAVKAGADVNMCYEEDGDDTYLSELYFVYVQTKIGILEEGEDWKKVATEKGIDGQYLPRITKFFLDHGFDVNRNHHAHGGMALYNLLFSSYDGYMLECARLLLDAGADLFYHPYGEYEDIIDCVYSEWDFYNGNDTMGESDDVKAKALEKMVELLEAYADQQRPYISTERKDGGDYLICLYRGEREDWEMRDISEEKYYIVEETVGGALLRSVLEKYLDDELPPNKERFDTKGFDYWGSNYYTLDVFEKLLDELHDLQWRLLESFDEVPSEITSMLWIADFRKTNTTHDTDPESKKIEYARDNVGLIIDFYQRFTNQMRELLKIGVEQNYPYVLVEGP